ARRRGIDDLGGIEALDQETDPPVDLAQPLLAVDVITVLRSIAVARRPRNGGDELGPLFLYEALELGRQTGESAGCHVIARADRQWRQRLDVIGVVARLGFARESLVHRSTDAGNGAPRYGNYMTPG